MKWSNARAYIVAVASKSIGIHVHVRVCVYPNILHNLQYYSKNTNGRFLLGAFFLVSHQPNQHFHYAMELGLTESVLTALESICTKHATTTCVCVLMIKWINLHCWGKKKQEKTHTRTSTRISLLLTFNWLAGSTFGMVRVCVCIAMNRYMYDIYKQHIVICFGAK